MKPASPWAWVAVGAALRFLWPDDFLFRQDEAEHFAYALDLAAQGEWPAHAWPSSAGVPNGPMFLWWLLALARVTTDPRGATAAMILMNVAALALAVPLLRRLLPDRRQSTIAVALLATNPVAIWFSRKLWDPCLLAIFTVPALLIALHAMDRAKARSIVLLPILLAAGALTHQSAAFFGVALMAVLLLEPRRLAWGWLLAGGAMAVALVFPYASFLIEDGAAHGLGGGSRSAYPDIDVITNLFLDASGHNILQAAGREGGRLLLWPIPPVGLLIQLAAAPLLIAAVAGLRETIRERPPDDAARRRRRLVLLVPAGLVILYLVFLVRGVAHYFLALMPLLTVWIVRGHDALRAGPPTRRRKVMLTLPVLVAINAASWLGFQSFQSLRHGSDSYGLPYGDILKSCRAVVLAADARGLDPAEPIVLRVDVPRDRGVVPAAYRFVLERELGRRVDPAGQDRPADLVLRIRWPNPRRGVPWEVVDPAT